MAEIYVNNQYWVGNVEIHRNSSEWYSHNHHKDPCYSNIILHVVFNEDVEIPWLTTLVLSDHLNEKKLQQILSELESQKVCFQLSLNDLFSSVENTISYDELILRRLDKKADNIERELKSMKNDWEETFYISLARNFGFVKNALPFEWMARNTPLTYTRRIGNNHFQLESLYFGQSGMLNEESEDEYYIQMKWAYSVLRRKFGLNNIDHHVWKFMRMRPLNFPTLRIAQFTDLMHRNSGIFSKVLETKSAKEMSALFSAQACEYWNSKYSFSRESPDREKHLGNDSINNLIINTVVPFLWLFGRRRKAVSMRELAMRILLETPPETNGIMRQFGTAGVIAENAMMSQALLELNSEKTQ